MNFVALKYWVSRLGGKVSIFHKFLDKVKYSNLSKLEKQQLQLHL